MPPATPDEVPSRASRADRTSAGSGLLSWFCPAGDAELTCQRAGCGNTPRSLFACRRCGCLRVWANDCDTPRLLPITSGTDTAHLTVFVLLPFPYARMRCI